MQILFVCLSICIIKLCSLLVEYCSGIGCFGASGRWHIHLCTVWKQTRKRTHYQTVSSTTNTRIFIISYMHVQHKHLPKVCIYIYIYIDWIELCNSNANNRSYFSCLCCVANKMLRLFSIKSFLLFAIEILFIPCRSYVWLCED